MDMEVIRMKLYNIPYEYIELGIVKLTPSFYVLECLKTKSKYLTGFRVVDIKNKLGNMHGRTTILAALRRLRDQGIVERLPGGIYKLK